MIEPWLWIAPPSATRFLPLPSSLHSPQRRGRAHRLPVPHLVNTPYGVAPWKTPAGLGGAVAGERLYSLDFAGVTDSLKGMQQIRAQDQGRGGHVLSSKNASESFSTISTPIRYGVTPGDAALEKESGDGDM